MWNKVRIKEIASLLVFFALVLGVGISSSIIDNKSAKRTTRTYAAELANVSLEPYCKDGYYSIPGEPEKCSRAPGCGGYDYDELNVINKMPNPQSCTTNPHACGGKPPLCCYEMARTGDFTKCIGYWERLWCPKQLCDEARANGASDGQCGGSCQCNHAFGHYCGDNVKIISIAERLGQTAPTSTPNTPTPTSTQAPQPPTASPTTPRPVNTATTIPSPTRPNTTQAPAVTTAGQPTLTSPAQIPTPTTQTQAQQPTTATSQSQDDDTVLPTFEPPRFELPKIAIKDVVKPENIEKMNKATDPPLTAVKDGFETIQKYDQKLESFVERYVKFFYEAIKNTVRSL
ncbi:hypothetical protein A2861_02960 [Candidatus Roizmanbacteria bacterium RIFCSPHIGHO2_01_FULL_38_15]|nr:MAG: hypothetical protein A2861_02960 [Candidatus Roizmanbacteria bacterium RIFCSPHIGHO2_01_FULL_38_15]OGK36263.1 MAG: hypothetical protein A3F59_00100 [Candidatus Roizmanbacteria bacterium RIFCSPHIGHO2_12_FULL_38_13]